MNTEDTIISKKEKSAGHRVLDWISYIYFATGFILGMHYTSTIATDFWSGIGLILTNTIAWLPMYIASLVL